MQFNIFCFILVYLLIGFVFGNIVKYYFPKVKLVNYSVLGILFYMGIVQFLTYFLVFFKVGTDMVLLVYLGVFILGVILLLVKRIPIKIINDVNASVR